MKTTLRILAVLVLASITSPAQLISGFESPSQVPGAMVTTGGTDPEGWVSIFGQQMYMPDGVNQVGPCALPLDPSSQWCEVCPYFIGPANPVVPPSTPGIWPFVQGSVSEMQIQTTVPVFASQQTALILDWYFFSGETQNGSAGSGGGFDDFAQVAVIDPTTNTVIVVALYVDTWAPAFTAMPNTCASGVSGTVWTNRYGGPGQTAMAQIPSQYFGAQVLISVVAANQLANNFDSVLYIDNLQWVDPTTLTPPFALTAATTGGGIGDLTFGVANPPVLASHVNILVSGTPAPLGLGTGLAFGLVPDALLIVTLFEPALPMSLTHFPVTADPYVANGGPFILPPTTLSPLAGQIWEAVAVAYSAAGLVELSNFAQLAW